MPLLLLIFIVVPIVELAVIIKVGQWIGLWPTVALLFLSAILGSVLLRSQGRAAWARFNEALAERRMPHKEVMDGVMIIFGGALLLTPGFITDVVGLAFLIPPSRHAIRGFASKFFLGRYYVAGKGAAWGYERVRGGGGRQDAPRPENGSAPGGPPPRRPSRAYDVEGTAHEVQDETLLGPPPPPPEPDR